jgi:hypothetical protein
MKTIVTGGAIMIALALAYATVPAGAISINKNGATNT